MTPEKHAAISIPDPMVCVVGSMVAVMAMWIPLPTPNMKIKAPSQIKGEGSSPLAMEDAASRNSRMTRPGTSPITYPTNPAITTLPSHHQVIARISPPSTGQTETVAERSVVVESDGPNPMSVSVGALFRATVTGAIWAGSVAMSGATPGAMNRETAGSVDGPKATRHPASITAT